MCVIWQVYFKMNMEMQKPKNIQGTLEDLLKNNKVGSLPVKTVWQW